MAGTHVFSVAELEELSRNPLEAGANLVALHIEDYNSLLDQARAALRLPDMVPGAAISTDMTGTTYEHRLHAALYYCDEEARKWRSGLPYDELVAVVKKIEEIAGPCLKDYSRR